MKNIFLAIKSHIRLKPFDVSSEGGRSSERHRRIFLAGISSLLSKGMAVAVVFISTPLVYDYLGAERFGIWMTISSMVAALGFADLGIGNGLLNIISEANGKDDRALAKRAVSTAIVLLGVVGLLIGFALVFANQFIDWEWVLNINKSFLAQEAQASMLVIFICLAMSVPLLTAQKVQAGYQEGFHVNLWQALGSTFMLVGVLLAIHVEASLPWLLLATVGGPVIAMSLNWIHQFLFVRKWLLPDLKNFELSLSFRLMSMGGMWAWSNLMGFVAMAGDNLIIAHFYGMKTAGAYAVMYKLFSILFVAQILSAPLWPAIAEALERGDIDWVRRAFYRITGLFLVLGSISALIMGIGSFWIIEVWIGEEMMPSGWLATGFALWCIIINFFAALSALMSNSKMIKALTILTSIGALLSLILKFAFVPLLGADWIVWATVIGYGVTCIVGFFIAQKWLNREEQVTKPF